MDSERLRLTERLYHAHECAPDIRFAFLNEAADGDENLGRGLESQLRQSAEGVLDQPHWPSPGSQTAEALIGWTISHYRILEKVGGGGMTMSSKRWRRIEHLYHAALDRPPSERDAFLAAACEGDADLKENIESLLEQPSGSLLDAPAWEHAPSLVARQVLGPGALLGPYRVIDAIGSGGMGEVYRAKDSRLGREVAIKVLPEHLAKDSEARERFEREARVVSSLNHPRICTLHDLGSQDGINYVVMEYLEGETLAQRLKKGPLPTDQVLEYAMQIADALDAAHRHGVIHRDVKPGNIMLTENGAKLLDFGLAKMPSAEAVAGENGLPGKTTPLTAKGDIVGTLQYMAPEQLEGKEADARTDLFALGSVLYEMATGRRPFEGATQAVVYEAMLNGSPRPPALINPEVPAKLEAVIYKALKKDRSLRYHCASAIRADLQQVKRGTESEQTLSTTSVFKPPVRSGRLVTAWLVAAVSLIAAVAAVLYLPRRDSQAEAAMRVRPLTNYPGGQYEPAFSPDGSQVAFVWNGDKQDNFDIYVKLVDGGAPLRLTTNPASEGSPAWSPDGHEIAFLRYSGKPGESGFYIVPALGGPERRIGDAAPRPHIFDRHLDWSPDGQLLAVADKTDPGDPFGIYLLSIQTGERHRITAPPASSIGDTGPAFSPDGRTLAFRRSINPSVNDIYVVPVTGGEPKRLTFDHRFTANHAWTPDGRELVFSSTRAGIQSLWRVPASGGAAKQISSVGQGAYYIAVSRKGHYLAYSRWFADTNIWQLAIGAKKTARPEELISSTWEERSAQYSPDGARIAFRSDRSGNNEIWVCDASGSNPLQLTSFGGPLTGTPRWSPDGRNLAFDSQPEGNSVIYTISALGGVPHRITTSDSDGAVPSWSRDGKWIYFASNRANGSQVWKIPVKGGVEDGDPLQVTRHGGFAAFESLDGQWLYYSKGRDARGLWVVPAKGGEERPVIPNFNVGFWGYWAVVARGIYFLAPLPPGRAGVNFYSFDRHSINLIAVLPKEPPFGDSGFAVSADERRILYTQVDHSGSDIMLVEGFR